MNWHLLRWPLVCLVLVACQPRGCVEANLELGDSSRLPSWFTVPAGLTRKDIHIAMAFYTYGDVKIEIKGPSGVLSKEIGIDEWHPVTKKQEFSNYPFYTIVTVRGISDVYEQRAQEPFIYITDDPELTKVLKKK